MLLQKNNFTVDKKIMEEKYILPNIENGIFTEKLVKRKADRINFFGEEGFYSTKERVDAIMEINNQVFSDECGFQEEIMSLFASGSYVNQLQSLTLSQPPKDLFAKTLTTTLLGTNPTIHHIIFKSNKAGGHPRRSENLKELAAGKHKSFHNLLANKVIYPHQQISSFLRYEKSLLEKGFYEELVEIENTYNSRFLENIDSVYKRSCFSHKFLSRVYNIAT